MCDFAILSASKNTARLLAIELKRGAADTEDLEQLVEGLALLHQYFEVGRLKPRPAAFFAVGKERDRFGFAVRDQLSRLMFGSKPAKLGMLDCGDRLHL